MADCDNSKTSESNEASQSDESPNETAGESSQPSDLVANCEEASHQPELIPGEKVASIEDVVNSDPECYELDLNHHRIDKLENLEPLTQLEHLYLRWNLIKKIENLHTLTTLVEQKRQQFCITNMIDQIFAVKSKVITNR